MLHFCNRKHQAIAFVGVDCPLCLLIAARGAPMLTTRISGLHRGIAEWFVERVIEELRALPPATEGVNNEQEKKAEPG